MLKYILILIYITTTICVAYDPEMYIKENDNFGGTKEDYYMNNFKGNYRYSFENPNNIKQFQDGFPDGGKIGFYSFVGPDGRFYITCYTAVNGYRAKSIIVVTDMPYDDLQEFCQKKFNVATNTFGDLSDVNSFIEKKKTEPISVTATAEQKPIRTRGRKLNTTTIEVSSVNPTEILIDDKPKIDIGLAAQESLSLKPNTEPDSSAKLNLSIDDGTKDPIPDKIQKVNRGNLVRGRTSSKTEINKADRGGKASNIAVDIDNKNKDDIKPNNLESDNIPSSKITENVLDKTTSQKLSLENKKNNVELEQLKTTDNNIPLIAGKIPLTDKAKLTPETDILIPVEVKNPLKPGKSEMIFSSIPVPDKDNAKSPNLVPEYKQELLDIPIPDEVFFPESLDRNLKFDPTNGKKANPNGSNDPKVILGKDQKGENKPSSSVAEKDKQTFNNKAQTVPNINNPEKIVPSKIQTNVAKDKLIEGSVEPQKPIEHASVEIPIQSSISATLLQNNNKTPTPLLENARVIGMRANSANRGNNNINGLIDDKEITGRHSKTNIGKNDNNKKVSDSPGTLLTDTGDSENENLPEKISSDNENNHLGNKKTEGIPSNHVSGKKSDNDIRRRPSNRGNTRHQTNNNPRKDNDSDIQSHTNNKPTSGRQKSNSADKKPDSNTDSSFDGKNRNHHQNSNTDDKENNSNLPNQPIDKDTSRNPNVNSFGTDSGNNIQRPNGHINNNADKDDTSVNKSRHYNGGSGIEDHPHNGDYDSKSNLRNKGTSGRTNNNSVIKDNPSKIESHVSDSNIPSNVNSLDKNYKNDDKTNLADKGTNKKDENTLKNRNSGNQCIEQVVTKIMTQPVQTVTVTIQPTATQQPTLSVPTALSSNSCRAKIVVEDNNKKIAILNPTESEMKSIKERAARTLNCGSLTFLSK